jgi:uncharacterized protein (TIGR02996 family)
MTATSDGTLLLSAIGEQPVEDTPRLLYADWLDESGGDSAHAEFIRLQIKRSALQRGGHGCADAVCPKIDFLRKNKRPGGQMMPTCELCTDVEECELREQQLLTANEPRWRAAPCPECGGSGTTSRTKADGWGLAKCEHCQGGDCGGLLRRLFYPPPGFEPEDGLTSIDLSEPVRVVWRRGFAEVVEVPTLADCVQTDYAFRTVPAILLAQLCTPTPYRVLSGIVPLDREPYHFAESAEGPRPRPKSYPFAWHRLSSFAHRDGPDLLPDVIFESLPEREYDTRSGRFFTIPADALSALGRAVFAFGKR